MQKHLHLLLTGILILFPGSLLAQRSLERSWQPDREKVRIISYNIMDGFDYLKDQDRINRFVDWIKEKDPEVLVLQELCGFKEKDLQELAASYGHPHSVILKEDGYPIGVTSKKPINLVNKLRDGYWHGVLHVQTYNMDFIGVHLSPSNYDFRIKEARSLYSYIQENCPETAIVLGDFNSHSPFDADELESHALRMQQMAMSFGKSQKPGKFHVDYSVQSTFLSIPLLDVCRLYVKPENRTTIPTRLLIGTSKREDMHALSGERIDFILVSPQLLGKVSDAFIFNGPDTDYLSDHYPVGMDMVLVKEK